MRDSVTAHLIGVTSLKLRAGVASVGRVSAFCGAEGKAKNSPFASLPLPLPSSPLSLSPLSALREFIALSLLELSTAARPATAAAPLGPAARPLSKAIEPREGARGLSRKLHVYMQLFDQVS